MTKPERTVFGKTIGRSIHRNRIIFLGLLLFIPFMLFAQTSAPPTPRSFLLPGDSLSVEIALQPGDVLKWSVWLATALPETRSTTLILRSDIDGDLWRKSYGSEALDLKDETKIAKSARYRLVLVTEGKHGRAATISAWPTLGKSDPSPFPIPDVRRFAEKFSAGDKSIAEFEFVLPDSISYQRLLSLDLPLDMVHMWIMTVDGDSFPATTSFSRWPGGNDGVLSFVGGKVKGGGRITFRLELSVIYDGEATLYLAPGAHPPRWLPAKARLVMSHEHNPWSMVTVPPRSKSNDQAAQAPIALATYRVQGLRTHGVDSTTISRLSRVYTERDSLAEKRWGRLGTISTYDTLFLTAQSAFLPPEMHIIISEPLCGQAVKGKTSPPVNVSWFVENYKEGSQLPRVYKWSYDEARIAIQSAPDEWFWDSNIFPLRPALEIAPIARPDHPASVTLQSRVMLRPSVFERNGERFMDNSQRVWGFFLENTTPETLYFVYHQSHKIDKPLMQGYSRWPIVARYGLPILAVIGLAGVFSFIELRRRENKRKQMAKELDAELEKARQVQLKLLPSGPMTVKGLEVLGLHQSMQSVGGDYYDFFTLDDGRVVLCVADVAGHGLHAALLMANLQATLHAIVRTGKPLTEIVSLLNRDMFQRTPSDQFVTMLLAEISADRTQIAICNAGHNPGYIVRQTGDIEELDAGGIMLGVMDVWPYIQMEYNLNPGDIIAFYTDGIPEAEIGFEDMFGYERLKYYLSNHSSDRLVDIAQNLFLSITPQDSGSIADDMAIVLVRITG